MTACAHQADGEISRIAAEWHEKWNDIKTGHYSPVVLGHKFEELNEVARRLAHAAHGHDLNLEEIAQVTEIELAILKDELHSAVLHQAC